MARKGSAFLDILNSAILDMKETGFIEKLEGRWFKSGDCFTSESSTVTDTESLVMTAEQMSGIFITGLGMFGLGVLLVFGEFIFAAFTDIEKYRSEENGPKTVCGALTVRLAHVWDAIIVHIRTRFFCQHVESEDGDEDEVEEVMAAGKRMKSKDMYRTF
ncbi:uncharacterized protein LOC135496611 [Lineus longissimus]|uniref:uncharacterized protein LOC135496611 n=1 Tax=Lineus longissimus TaxID=88925 RepID=UPI00315CF0CF